MVGSVATGVGHVPNVRRRTRAIAFVVVAATTAATFAFDAAEARKRPSRVVFEPYSPVGVNVLVLDFGDPALSLANVEFQPERGERAISVEVSDDSGDVVRGSIAQGRETIATFCGETEKAVPIDAAQPVRVHVYTGTCGGALGIASQGGVTARFR